MSERATDATPAEANLTDTIGRVVDLYFPEYPLPKEQVDEQGRIRCECEACRVMEAPHLSMLKDVESKLDSFIESLQRVSDSYLGILPSDVSISEAARLLGRSAEYVQGLLDSGELLHSEKRSVVKVSRVDLVEYFAFRAIFGFGFSSKPSPELPRRWTLENMNWQDRA